MSPEQERHALQPLLEVAYAAAQTMGPADKADLYEGLAIATRAAAPELSRMAAEAAQALRDAETRQLTFGALLRN